MRNNSFTLFRLLLAIAVIVSHAFILGGFGTDPLQALIGLSLGALAVRGFFIISGFLITASLFSNTPFIFLWKRIKRIFPAFWVCLGVTAGVFGAFFYWANRGSLHEYISLAPNGPIHYVLINSFLRITQYDIYQQPLQVPYPSSLNGSIWTLLLEFRAYCVLLFLGMIRWLRQSVVVGLIVVLFVIMVIDHLVPHFSYQHLLLFSHPDEAELWLYFFVGSFYFLAQKQIVFVPKYFWVGLVIAALSLKIGFYLIAPFILPYLLFYLAWKQPLGIDQWGDWSYGTYLYAFPIQQFLTVVGGAQWGYGVYTSLSIFLSVVMGYVSWHLIEKHFLTHRPRIEEKGL